MDLTYKFIQGEINMFELNEYDENLQLNWIEFYNQPWVLASLNRHYSQIDITIWCIAGETTNVAKSAHADINHEGKGLNLINAIEKALRFDNRKFMICTVQDKYGVAKTGRNNGPVAKATQLGFRAWLKIWACP
ncbi:cobalamin biosynthesis protein cobt [Gigaspora margarita]|uniref:Cobalamin biosynthesis protein cobt n=1 Tax=Gigaspora margarita TaxID=4874 RepID=A0A8H4EIG3_GIGMA|nr:cobalamin biosynthesis protein cobt [Gigaspora margarita]